MSIKSELNIIASNVLSKVRATSGSMRPTELKTLIKAYNAARHEAAKRLIEMELIHRHIVSQRGTVR